MGISLNPANLFSKQVRQQIGQKVLSGNPLFNIGGQAAVSFSAGLRGFLVAQAISAIPALTWNLTDLWSEFTSLSLELFYFDWNQPDDQLDRQAQAAWTAYGASLGNIVGNSLGYFSCGIVPSSTLFAIDERLALYVLNEVGEEAYQEFSAQVSNALRLANRNLIRQSASWLYKGARRIIMNEDNPLGELIFGSRVNEIRESFGTESWTFAQAIEEKIETIPSAFWQNFTEEVIDEFIDACIEAGYVAAQSAQGFYASQLNSRSLINGRERVVEIFPDRSNNSEKLILGGYENHLRSQIPSVISSYRLVENRDVGQIIGEPIDDYVRQNELSLRIKFQLYGFPEPPFNRGGESVRVNITIPDVKRSALDWQLLRLAVGGANGYLWGRFKARGRIEGKRYVTVYGATPDEAEDRLRSVMTLSNARILSINTTEELRTDDRLLNPKLQKEITRVYPGHVTIINRDRRLALDQGRGSVDGNFADRRYRFELWRDEPPLDFDQLVAELLRFANE